MRENGSLSSTNIKLIFFRSHVHGLLINFCISNIHIDAIRFSLILRGQLEQNRSLP